MNRLIENHYITEIKYGTDFAYILKEDSSFLPTEYKMLQSQESESSDCKEIHSLMWPHGQLCEGQTEQLSDGLHVWNIEI